MKITTIIRLILTAMFLVLIWCDYQWALYMAVTALAINTELQGYINNKTIECMELLNKIDNLSNPWVK
jgi:hypothetical protein